MNQDPFSAKPVDVVAPSPGNGDDALLFLTWLVAKMSKVIPGERLAELVFDGVLLYLEAPCQGILVEQIPLPRDKVNPGEVVARIFPEQEEI